MKKSGISLMLALLLILAAAACSSGDKPQPAGASGGANNPVEIGKVIVGTDGAYPPFNYLDSGNQLTGFEIKMLEEISKRTGLEIETQVMAWDGIFGQLDSSKIDTIVCCIFPNEDRQAKYDFTREYIYDENRIIVRKGDGAKYKTPQDLAGLKIGVTGGGNSMKRLEEVEKEVGFEIVPYSKDVEIYDLDQGRLDGYYKSPVAAMAMAKESGIEIEIAECPSLEKSSCSFPFRRDARSQAIKAAFSKAIQEMIDDGTMKALSEEWLGMDVTAYEPLFNF